MTRGSANIFILGGIESLRHIESSWNRARRGRVLSPSLIPVLPLLRILAKLRRCLTIDGFSNRGTSCCVAGAVDFIIVAAGQERLQRQEPSHCISLEEFLGMICLG
jgi:hypothetical protein